MRILRLWLSCRIKCRPHVNLHQNRNLEESRPWIWGIHCTRQQRCNAEDLAEQCTRSWLWFSGSASKSVGNFPCAVKVHLSFCPKKKNMLGNWNFFLLFWESKWKIIHRIRNLPEWWGQLKKEHRTTSHEGNWNFDPALESPMNHIRGSGSSKWEGTQKTHNLIVDENFPRTLNFELPLWTCQETSLKCFSKFAKFTNVG